MTQAEARGAPPMPGVGRTLAQAKPRPPAGSNRKRVRPSPTRQDPWEDASWSPHRWGRAAPSPRGPRPRTRGDSRAPASPENAARERSRVRALRGAFLALQAALPTVPPHTKLSRLDVLLLATSYIAHLTRTLGHELPARGRPPFLRGLRYLHPLKKWPMRSRLYACGLDTTPATTSGLRTKEAKAGPQGSVEAGALVPASTPSPGGE
ncbi:transcription factor 23 [Sorex araneus]|uniref:transcription factor 23 n=1 Tax=Sorex araneus TaxID=42254 RepID=UPI00243383EB|nr:transcription factor 23 [Sorex araneus]